MKSNLYLFSVCLLLAGCLSRQSESIPISGEELEALMLDVHVAESAVSGMPNGFKKDSVANLYYEQIAEIHHIDRAILDSCVLILQRNPELASEVYEKLSEQLEKKALSK